MLSIIRKYWCDASTTEKIIKFFICLFFFKNTVDSTPDLFSMGTNKGNTNRIVITGGTFVNWNPLEDRMCYTGEWPAEGESAFSGPWMLIPGNYKVVSETQSNGEVWYTVVEK